MNFEKTIWKLFKINRGEFNRFDMQVEKILQDVYNKGLAAGRKEERKMLRGIIEKIQ